jgi:RNA polymerase sigma factor (sigma-70 family)
MGSDIESLVELAREGDRTALTEILLRLKDQVFGLAVRMLGNPDDAEDAAQEILIKVTTHLSTFRQESAFNTWVYRIAANHLLTARKRRSERLCSNFDDFAVEIDRGLASQWPMSLPEPEMKLQVEEMMISCTQGILLCLDRNHRLAYILGEIFEVSSEQGGYILGITSAAFRKRLSRSRKRLHNFMINHCGLIRSSNPCTCERQVLHIDKQGCNEVVDRRFTSYPCLGRHDPGVMARLQEFDELERVAVLFRSHPEYCAPESYIDNLKELMLSGQFELFNGQK